jgi:hypothetical protein
MGKKSKIKLKPGASIGEPAAEDDSRFLESSFINHPTIAVLKDVSSPQSVLLGRTGAGKSAILWHLENTLDHVTRINPKDVAFQYLGNSAILREVRALGVDLHTLFEYLWTHILALHVARECLGAENSRGVRGALDRLTSFVWRDQRREIAMRYLEKHADNFFLNVEEVSSEITKTISEKLAAEAGLSLEMFKATIEGGSDWRDEQKRVFRYRAQEVVSALQMRELKETINALAECMDKRGPFYILIDDLDLEWAGDENTQYALIRALIESLKTFRRIPNLKIVVALREDLYEATLRTTTDKHFQAEKLEGVIQRLRWSDGLLISMVEKRIQQLYKYSYTNQAVTMPDVLPSVIAQSSIRDYLVGRTLRRPRDIIALINKILRENEGENLPLSVRSLTKIEGGYSSDRMRALEDEWRSCHPLVRTYVNSIQGLTSPASVQDIDEDKLFSLLFEVDGLGRKPVDEVERAAKTVYERDKDLRIEKLARVLVRCLYKLGVVGVKLNTSKAYSFCYEHRASLDDGEVGEDAKFLIHPMFASSLASRPAKADAA